jgi:Winged helix-turn-helix DNA-binding
MTVQDLSFLLAEGPLQLLERPLAEYGRLLREAESLPAESVEAVDYAACHMVVRLLVRAAGDEELVAAYDDLRRLAPVSRETELASWIPRWRGFADLLDTRLAMLSTRDPEVVLRRAHAPAILELVQREPGLTQAEVGQRLGLKPANLSRILGMLEAHELIERRNLGRERRLHPGRLAPAAAPTAARGGELQRGSFFLCRQAS